MSTQKITLTLGDDDYRSIQNATRIRSQMAVVPCDSDPRASLVADICRSWLKLLGQPDPPLVNGWSVAELVRRNTNEELSE